MRTLYQFPLSHYCEKARWLLDYKELDYVAKNLIPGLHRPFVQLKTSKNTLPMLRDGKTWIADSTEIALYLDGMYPEQPYLRREPEFRAQALELDQIASQIGFHTRRWMYLYLIDEPETREVMLGEQGFLRWSERFSWPIIKKGVIRLYGITPKKSLAAKQKLDVLINQVEEKLIQNGGRYLVSDRLGLADIAVCSLAAPLLGPQGTPWQVDDPALLPVEIHHYREQLLDRPIGQYIMRIYQTERHARVDWRGV
ncbi:glutathione S-transferase family protein [Alkanindiges sp. WGS2144]|uniref:glutathione S-transferase family protein n=1 Tax=Alkanindiges sp. WGS2144 TaxID=3366808 RepID=UPI003751E290